MDYQPFKDLIYSGRDTVINNFYSTATLKYKPIDPSTFLDTTYFVTGPSYQTLLAKSNGTASTLILVGDPNTGRRETALQVLKNSIKQFRSILEVSRDWDDQFDATLIPQTEQSGFLLDLTETFSNIQKTFIDSLVDSAESFYKKRSLLILLVSNSAWSYSNAVHVKESSSPYLSFVNHSPVSPTDIAEMHLKGSIRHRWITDPQSVFSGLITEGTPPSDSVELARIVRHAESMHDSDAVDEYLDWDSRVTEWFLDPETEDINLRSVLIALAFFDGEEDRLILDAKDELLSDTRIGWSPSDGGALGGREGNLPFQTLGLSSDHRKRVSILNRFPGIDNAIVANIWITRPQLRHIVIDWLTRITRPGGVAQGKHRRLPGIFVELARQQGPDTLIPFLEKWTESSISVHNELSMSILCTISVDPRVGARVRNVLADWAKRTSSPKRQQAVLSLITTTLGRDYPNLSLTRMRYVLERPAHKRIKDQAFNSLFDFATSDSRVNLVLLELVKWLNSTTSSVSEAGQASFRQLFTYEDIETSEESRDYATQLRSNRIREILSEIDRLDSIDSLIFAWVCYWRSCDDSLLVYAHLNTLFSYTVSANFPEGLIEDLARGIFFSLDITPSDGSMQIFFGDSKLDDFKLRLFDIWRSAWTQEEDFGETDQQT